MNRIKGFLVLAGGLIRSVLVGLWARIHRFCQIVDWEGLIRFVIICAVLALIFMMLKGCAIEPGGLVIGEIDCDRQTLCEEG